MSQFRSQFDFLNPEFDGELPTGPVAPPVENRSSATLGIELSDREWAEFERRIDLMALAPSVMEIAVRPSYSVSERPDSTGAIFAGLWQDHWDLGRIHIALAAPVDEYFDQLERVFPRGGEDFRLHEVKYSYDDLREFAETAKASLHDRGVQDFKVSVDEPNNAVRVTYAGEPMMLDGIPSDAVEMEPQPAGWTVGAKLHDPTAKHNTNNQQSGLQIAVYHEDGSNGRTCTWGLTGHNGSFNQLVTAVHCRASATYGSNQQRQSDWWQDADSYARVQRGNNKASRAVNTIDADVMRIRADARADTNCYMLTGHCSNRTTKRMSYGFLNEGQTICASLGSSNTHRCGVITDWPVDFVLGGNAFDDRIEVLMQTSVGDSGAGGIFGSTIMGILDTGNSLYFAYFTNPLDAKLALGSDFDFNCVKTGSTWGACPLTTSQQ